MTCTSCGHARRVSSPNVSSSANCARSLASWMDPGRSESPSEIVTSYCAEDLAEVVEPLVERILLAVVHHPARRAAIRRGSRCR